MKRGAVSVEIDQSQMNSSFTAAVRVSQFINSLAVISSSPALFTISTFFSRTIVVIYTTRPNLFQSENIHIR